MCGIYRPYNLTSYITGNFDIDILHSANNIKY